MKKPRDESLIFDDLIALVASPEYGYTKLHLEVGTFGADSNSMFRSGALEVIQNYLQKDNYPV